MYLALDGTTFRGTYLLPFTSAPDGPRPWIEADDQTVVVGNDAGDAWMTQFDSRTFSEWQR